MLGILCLSDHNTLRDDALLALAVGKVESASESATAATRWPARAGSTGSSSRRRISYEDLGIQRLFVEEFLRAHPKPLAEIVLDLDATDDSAHG